MPPQGYVIGGGLALNYLQSRLGGPTISQLGRRHPIVTAVVLVGFNAWIWPHLYFKES